MPVLRCATPREAGVRERARSRRRDAPLLAQSLAARQREEEAAKEAEEVHELEADLASKEQRLLDDVEKNRTSLTLGPR